MFPPLKGGYVRKYLISKVRRLELCVMARLVLAEDDPAIIDPLLRALRRDGHEVVVAGDGPAALDTCRDPDTDLLLLDLGLPGMDGLDVCRALRDGGSRLPVVVITARGEEADAVVALDAGADDYVIKPFRLGELLARVRAQLRRGPAEPPHGAPVAAQDVRLDPASHRCYVGDGEVLLTNKEYDILYVLLRQAGYVVTRENLLREVWGPDWFGTQKILDVTLSGLRRKLGDDVNQPRYIATVRGIGFRFETK